MGKPNIVVLSMEEGSTWRSNVCSTKRFGIICDGQVEKSAFFSNNNIIMQPKYHREVARTLSFLPCHNYYDKVQSMPTCYINLQA